ncbi:hypothetical protein ACFE04_030169 [Oxalis oulophora]
MACGWPVVVRRGEGGEGVWYGWAVVVRRGEGGEGVVCGCGSDVKRTAAIVCVREGREDGGREDDNIAIRKHNFVNILDIQGSPDLSAYVDFSAIKHSAEEASETVSVYGLMTQLNFFGSLGINFRVEVLLQNCTDEQVESMRT